MGSSLRAAKVRTLGCVSLCGSLACGSLNSLSFLRLEHLTWLRKTRSIDLVGLSLLFTFAPR